MSKTILCTDGVKRTPREYGRWLKNLQDLAEQEPGDLTNDELQALQNEGLWYQFIQPNKERLRSFFFYVQAQSDSRLARLTNPKVGITCCKKNLQIIKTFT